MFRKVSSTTSSDSFQTSKDDDKTESIEEESMHMGEESLLQMQMAEEIGAVGGVVPSWSKPGTTLHGKPPLPPSLPNKEPTKSVLNPKKF